MIQLSAALSALLATPIILYFLLTGGFTWESAERFWQLFVSNPLVAILMSFSAGMVFMGWVVLGLVAHEWKSRRLVGSDTTN